MFSESSFCPDSFLGTFLSGPVEEFLARPKKDFRGDLVKIGFALYSHDQNSSKFGQAVIDLGEMLEWIHSGSLIVDDIQDDSPERRGQQSLHRLYGMPCALNAANWMYFEALKKVHLLPVSDTTKIKILYLTHHAMALAHQGQAFDLMAHMSRIPRENIFELGMKSHELKSGVLVGLALQVGALLADEEADVKTLGEMGNAIGTSLQRFDDLGNLKLGSQNRKALEDLRLGRASWVWMFLSRHHALEDFIQFKVAVDLLPDERPLKIFLEKTNLKKLALSEAQRLHQEILHYFIKPFPGKKSMEALNQLKNLLEKISNAYT